MQPKNLLIIMSDQHSRDAWAATAIPRAKRRISTGLPTRARVLMLAGPPPRSAFLRGRLSRPASTSTRSDSGTTPIPMTAQCRAGITACAMPATGRLHRQTALPIRRGRLRLLGSHHSHASVEGKGDLLGLIRDDLPVRGAAYKMARMAGPGESAYTQYDRDIAARAQIWLREEAHKHTDKPWVLFVSFVCAALSAHRAARAFLPLFRRSEPADAAVLRGATSGQRIRSSAIMRARSISTTISRLRTISAAPSPGISGCAASWTSRPARCWRRLRRRGSTKAPV